MRRVLIILFVVVCLLIVVVGGLFVWRLAAIKDEVRMQGIAVAPSGGQVAIAIVDGANATGVRDEAS